MKHLAPYRGTLFRLALTNALLVGIVAMAFLLVENLRQQRAAHASFTINSGRQHLGSANLPDRTGPSETDEHFIQTAAQLAWEQVRVAELGAQRASRPEVRGYARELARERVAVRNQIESLAARKGVLLPTGESRSVEADALAGVPGRGFDERFIQWTKTRQSSALQLFERAATESTDSEIREFAGRMLPRLQAQLEQARRLSRPVF